MKVIHIAIAAISALALGLGSVTAANFGDDPMTVNTGVYITMTITPAGPNNVIVSFGRVIGGSNDHFKVVLGGSYITDAGPHRVPPVGTLPIGNTIYTGGGGGGGGGGGNKQHQPTSGDSVEVIITDTYSGKWSSYTVRVPFVTGWVSVKFTGDGYMVDGYSVTSAGVTLSTNGQLSVAQNLFWKQE